MPAKAASLPYGFGQTQHVTPAGSFRRLPMTSAAGVSLSDPVQSRASPGVAQDSHRMGILAHCCKHLVCCKPLVPRLCLGTHSVGGSAGRKRGRTLRAVGYEAVPRNQVLGVFFQPQNVDRSGPWGPGEPASAFSGLVAPVPDHRNPPAPAAQTVWSHSKPVCSFPRFACHAWSVTDSCGPRGSPWCCSGSRGVPERARRT